MYKERSLTSQERKESDLPGNPTPPQEPPLAQVNWCLVNALVVSASGRKEVALPIARSASAPVTAAAHVARNVMLGWANHGGEYFPNHPEPWFAQASLAG